MAAIAMASPANDAGKLKIFSSKTLVVGLCKNLHAYSNALRDDAEKLVTTIIFAINKIQFG
jgi:hypothetical protein